MAKLKKVVPVKAEPTPIKPEPVPAPYQPRTPVSVEMRKGFYQAARQHWEDQADHYGWEDPVPENVQRRGQQIMSAPDLETAVEALARFKTATEWAMLGAWSKGDITGPNTPLSLERRAKRAESLAKMLDDKGLTKAAAEQRQRAQDLFRAATALKKV